MSSGKNDSYTEQGPSNGVSRRDFLWGATAATLAAAVAQSAAAASKSQISLSLPDYIPLPEKSRLRIGVVGGGFGLGFPWHLHPNCEVTAVADLRSDRRDKMKQAFECDNVYSEFHPMLKDPKVDAVAIYTYAPDHAQHCIDVMKAGKHVMTVIPVAVSLEDCRRLIDTVKSTGQTYMYGETGCFHPAAMAARRFQEEGKFGHIYHTDGEYTHAAYNEVEEEMKQHLVWNGKRTWRWGFPQGFYTGHAIGPVIHTIQENFVEVTAIGMEYQREMFKDNEYGNPFVNTTFFYKTSEGNSSRIKVHWLTAAPGREGADILGTGMSLHEASESLPARVYLPHQSAAIPLDLSPYSASLPPELRTVGGHGGSHSHIINEFVTACLEERKPYVDINDAVAITAPGIVGFESALRGGESMKIPEV